ncbi:MAG: cell division transport system ATP-binding protein [Thermodesulfobacterium sp.]|nr:cell division transport system ATP-binding protein [Thermodesulfobacterium sp.]
MVALDKFLDILKDVMEIFVIEKVTKVYNPYFKVLDEVSFTVKEGDFLILTGPTGAGKTTLLKLLYREEKPTDGEIFYKNLPYSKLKQQNFLHLRQNWGIIFQDYKLIPDLTVFENIKISLILSKKKVPKIKFHILNYLERFNLAPKAFKKVKELSGGEQQKVGIIRAIIREPELLIADEPTGNLDPESIKEIIKIFQEYQQAGKTVILATHDPVILQLNAGRILRLEMGRLVENVQTSC